MDESPCGLRDPYVFPRVLHLRIRGPRRFCPPLSGWSVVGGGAACSPRGIWSVPSGGRCGGNPESCNGMSYAWGPWRTHFRRDGNTYPGYNPSGTSHPSPTGSYYTSSHTGTMSAGAKGKCSDISSSPSVASATAILSPPPISLRLQKDCVKVYLHHNFRAPGAILECSENTIYH